MTHKYVYAIFISAHSKNNVLVMYKLLLQGFFHVKKLFYYESLDGNKIKHS